MTRSCQMSLTDKRSISAADREAGQTATELHTLVQKLCMSALTSNAKNRVHCLMILSQAANGVLHLLARSLMRAEDSKTPIHSTATLTAALMAYQVAPCEVSFGEVRAEFSPLVIFEAIKDFEKLTGNRPDDLLEDQMCRVARECAADPTILAAIEQGRAALDDQKPTLN